MASDEPGPGQMYAFQARKYIATLRKARPNITIGIRWCPAHKGAAGNENADEWAKLAVGEPDAHGVEWLGYSGRVEVRAMPLPRSLAHLKREISEKKWMEARQWAGGRTFKTKYRVPKSQRPDGTVAGSTKRLAPRGLPAEDWALPDQAAPPVGGEPTYRSVLVVPVPDANKRPPFQGESGMEGPAEGPGG